MKSCSVDLGVMINVWPVATQESHFLGFTPMLVYAYIRVENMIADLYNALHYEHGHRSSEDPRGSFLSGRLNTCHPLIYDTCARVWLKKGLGVQVSGIERTWMDTMRSTCTSNIDPCRYIHVCIFDHTMLCPYPWSLLSKVDCHSKPPIYVFHNSTLRL